MTEIARRFKRTPSHIERVRRWAQLPGRRFPAKRSGLRPVERRVLQMRAEGLDHREIARRFRRGEAHMRRVEGMAHFRIGRKLLQG